MSLQDLPTFEEVAGLRRRRHDRDVVSTPAQTLRNTADVLVQRVAVSSGSHSFKVQGRIASPGGTGGLAAFVSQPFTATAELKPASSGGKSCGLLTLRLGPIHLSLRGGLTIRLDPIELKLPKEGKELDTRLCALVRLVEGGGSAAEIKAALAEVNDILEKELIVIT